MRQTRFQDHEISKDIQVASVLYDFATDGGAEGEIELPGEIPSGALILNAVVDIEISPASAADAASLGAGLEAAEDLIASDTTDVAGFDAGLVAGVPLFATAATWIRTTEARRVVLTIADADLTAGRFWIHMFYIMPPTTAAALA